MSNEIAVLQAARLKGRPTPADVAAAAGTTEPEALDALTGMVGSGICKESNGRFMLTPEGRERLKTLLADERNTIDATSLRALYEQFDGHNSGLKQVVTAWQLRDGEPNDHSDAGYDQRVVDDLIAAHRRFSPLLDQMLATVGRLTPYASRFDHAVQRLRAGDTTFIARPIIDSYHTVWFELHEDLIGLLGLSREEEAAAGRAE